jgi:hypothetical protein
LARCDLLDPVQRQMVEVLANGDPGKQADGGQTAVNHRRRNRRRRYRLARTARVLRADVAMHEEARRFHVQLFADVLADLDQVGAALAALARFRLMAVLDARQFRWQRLAARTLALALGRCLAFELFLDGGQVHVDRFFEQQALLAGERFTGLAETDPAVIRQLMRQRRDLEVLLGQLGLLLCKQRPDLYQQRWVNVGGGKFVERVQAVQLQGRPPVYKRNSLRPHSRHCAGAGAQALPVHTPHSRPAART